MKRVWMLFLLLLPPFAQGQNSSVDHKAFLEGGHTRISQGGVDTNGWYGAGTLYFEEVSHGAQPHNQAAFLERAASMTVAYGNLAGDYPFLGRRDGDVEAVELQYITESHWVLGAGYNQLEIDALVDRRTRTLTLGRYLGDASRVLVSVGDADTSSIVGGESSDTTYSLEYKNVNVRMDGTAVTLDMKYDYMNGDGGSSNQVSVSGEYHVSLATSLTAEIDHTWGEASGTGYEIGVNQFFTRYFALGAKYSRNDPDAGTNTDTVTVFARVLF
ncbi:MAG: hypothetical protein U5O39_11100 [Gammaproteobacteria bacterium]|nr:hypothetical protein [Gammaproteobacteria bacterium]